MSDTRHHVHQLIDQLPPAQLEALAALLESMADPVARSIANAPIDDEPVSDEERRAVEASQEWFKKNPNGIPFEEVLADFGLNLEDVRNYKEPA
jgi:hypothetical protein